MPSEQRHEYGRAPDWEWVAFAGGEPIEEVRSEHGGWEWIESPKIMVPSRVTYRLSGGDGPTIEATFAMCDGVPGVVDLHVSSARPGVPLRADDVPITLHNLTRHVFEQFVYRETSSGTTPETFFQVDYEKLPASESRRVVGNKRVGRPPVPREELERVADAYRRNVDAKPLQYLQRHYSYSSRTAARRVQQARDAGLLPPTTRGKAGA